MQHAPVIPPYLICPWESWNLQSHVPPMIQLLREQILERCGFNISLRQQSFTFNDSARRGTWLNTGTYLKTNIKLRFELGLN